MTPSIYEPNHYEPPEGAVCAMCESPAGEFKTAEISAEGIDQFNRVREQTGNSPVCSKACLNALRRGDDGHR